MSEGVRIALSASFENRKSARKYEELLLDDVMVDEVEWVVPEEVVGDHFFYRTDTKLPDIEFQETSLRELGVSVVEPQSDGLTYRGRYMNFPGIVNGVFMPHGSTV